MTAHGIVPCGVPLQYVGEHIWRNRGKNFNVQLSQDWRNGRFFWGLFSETAKTSGSCGVEFESLTRNQVVRKLGSVTPSYL